MMLRKSWWAWLGCAAALVACDDPAGSDTPDLPVFPMDGGSSPVADTSAPGDAAVDASRPSTGPAYAVINSDWSSTAISLLDVEGNVLADNYLNSGSTTAGLVTTLSGDVEMPRASGEQGVMVILDRYRTDVITRIRIADGSILGQVKTHTPPEQNTTSSYSSNPHDYIYLDAETAYVTRGEPNLDVGAPLVDRGDDLFRINPTTMQRTTDRIDLGVLDQKLGDVTLYARPSRMVRLGRTVVVGIGRSAFDFKTVGDGVIGLVDLDTGAVTGFELPGLKSCTDVDAVPGDLDTVLVTCGGDWNDDSKDTAGLVLVGVSNGAARIEHIWRATATSSFTASTVSLGGTLVGAAVNNYAGTTPDVYAVIDVATAGVTTIKSITPGAGVFGTPAYDAATGMLFLPDASVDQDKKPTAGLRRFKRNAEGSFSELEIVKIAVRTDMPVRHIFPL